MRPRLALYQPDIPQNTGTILRLAACFDVAVDVIGPTGFDMTDRALRRAALDYIDHVSIARHLDWTAFADSIAQSGRRLVLATTQGATGHTDIAFKATDTLLFGRESAGVPPHVHEAADIRCVVPVARGLRSLNLAVAVSIVLGEALRQVDGFPMA